MFIEKIYNCTRTKEFSQFEETIATFFSGERAKLRESERERVGEREREREREREKDQRRLAETEESQY